jgi:hypothetical protein
VARSEGRSRFIFSDMDVLSRVSDANRRTMLEELRINRRCGFTLSGAKPSIILWSVVRLVGNRTILPRNLISEIALC